LTLLPLPYRNVLVFGRDATIEANLTEALAASRGLFRDLALCATDFAFETNADGVFPWVSPGVAFGHSAVELHASTCDLLFGADCLSARGPTKGLEIWCQAKSGAERCVELTTVPIQDVDGGWRGLRGVMRDVTTLKQHEREANGLRRREALINAVV